MAHSPPSDNFATPSLVHNTLAQRQDSTLTTSNTDTNTNASPSANASTNTKTNTSSARSPGGGGIELAIVTTTTTANIPAPLSSSACSSSKSPTRSINSNQKFNETSSLLSARINQHELPKSIVRKLDNIFHDQSTQSIPSPSINHGDIGDHETTGGESGGQTPADSAAAATSPSPILRQANSIPRFVRNLSRITLDHVDIVESNSRQTTPASRLGTLSSPDENVDNADIILNCSSLGSVHDDCGEEMDDDRDLIPIHHDDKGDQNLLPILPILPEPSVEHDREHLVHHELLDQHNAEQQQRRYNQQSQQHPPHPNYHQPQYYNPNIDYAQPMMIRIEVDDLDDLSQAMGTVIRPSQLHHLHPPSPQQPQSPPSPYHQQSQPPTESPRPVHEPIVQQPLSLGDGVSGVVVNGGGTNDDTLAPLQYHARPRVKQLKRRDVQRLMDEINKKHNHHARTASTSPPQQTILRIDASHLITPRLMGARSSHISPKHSGPFKILSASTTSNNNTPTQQQPRHQTPNQQQQSSSPFPFRPIANVPTPSPSSSRSLTPKITPLMTNVDDDSKDDEDDDDNPGSYDSRHRRESVRYCGSIQSVTVTDTESYFDVLIEPIILPVIVNNEYFEEDEPSFGYDFSSTSDEEGQGGDADEVDPNLDNVPPHDQPPLPKRVTAHHLYIGGNHIPTVEEGEEHDHFSSNESSPLDLNPRHRLPSPSEVGIRPSSGRPPSQTRTPSHADIMQDPQMRNATPFQNRVLATTSLTRTTPPQQRPAPRHPRHHQRTLTHGDPSIPDSNLDPMD